jgi:hypothetical protein
MGNDSNGHVNGHANGTALVNERTDKAGTLRLEVRVDVEECMGMSPEFGSIRTSMGVTAVLGRKYVATEKAGVIREMMMKFADNLRSRVETQNDQNGPAAFKRALEFADRKAAMKAEHDERRQLEGEARFERQEAERQRQRQQTGYRGPASAASPPHQGPPAMVEGDWDQGAQQINYRPQQQPLPTAPAPQRQNGQAPQAGYRMAPPPPAPSNQGAPSAGKPPRSARQLGGWIKGQSQEVKDLVKNLMAQEGWGWQCSALSDHQAMWLCQQIHAMYPAAGAV